MELEKGTFSKLRGMINNALINVDIFYYSGWICEKPVTAAGVKLLSIPSCIISAIFYQCRQLKAKCKGHMKDNLPKLWAGCHFVPFMFTYLFTFKDLGESVIMSGSYHVNLFSHISMGPFSWWHIHFFCRLSHTENLTTMFCVIC